MGGLVKIIIGYLGVAFLYAFMILEKLLINDFF